MADKVGRALALTTGFVAIAMMGAGAAQAQQIISAVQSELDPGDAADKQVSTAAGALVSTTFGGADSRARTDFGVNKIFARGTETHKQYATSAWLDSYTVGGASGTMVDLSFTINVHGAATGAFTENPEYNFTFYALRGDGWTMTGSGPTDFATPYSPINTGDQYEALLFNQVRGDGSFSQIDARDFSGVGNYLPGGDLFSKNSYDAASDTYSRIVQQNGIFVEQRFSATTYQELVDGVPRFAPIPYGALPPQVAQGRANLEANYQLLGKASFCTFAANQCGQLVTGPAGIDLTVNFSLAAGSTFSLAGYLFADDFRASTADFFNTVKLTGISASNGAGLTSASGTLVDLGNGQYGYQAVLADAVPEPAAWAMMITGFALIGATTRRRATLTRAVA